MHLRASHASVSACRGTLSSLFGEALTEEVLADVDPATPPLCHQDLMSCGDCRRCRCDGLCGYQEWKKRWESMLPRMEAAAIDQRRLRALLRPDAPKAKREKAAKGSSPRGEPRSLAQSRRVHIHRGHDHAAFFVTTLAV